MKRIFGAMMMMCLGLTVSGQTNADEAYQLTREQVLNQVLNSAPFDSICTERRVCFQANDLLQPGTLSLKKGNRKVKVKSETKLQGKNFLVLARFVTDPATLETASVQLYSTENKQTLNMYLVKDGEKWIIQNHKIFSD